MAERRTIRWTLALTALVALLVGGGIALVGSSTADARATFPDLRISASAARQQVADIRGHVDGAQATALANGQVTRAEYRAGVLATQACLERRVRAAGRSYGVVPDITFTTPQLTADGFEYRYEYSLGLASGQVDDLPPDALSRVSAFEEACGERHVLGLQQAYAVGLRADGSYVDGVAELLEDCLADTGVTVDVTGRTATRVLVEAAAAEEEAPATAEADTAPTTPEQGQGAADSIDDDRGVAGCVTELPSVTAVLDPATLERAWA